MALTALITGASAGIGSDFARILAADARVSSLVLVARRKERLDELAAEIQKKNNKTVHVIAKDLSIPDASEQLVQELEQAKINVDILVNNAGFGPYGRFLRQDLSKVEQMINLNILTLTKLTHLLGAKMLERKSGYILNVSSIGSFQPTVRLAPYAATKAYVMFLTEALHAELEGSGVSATTLYPGVTMTEFQEVADIKMNDQMTKAAMSSYDVAKIGLDAMFEGKRAVTSGKMNQAIEVLAGLLPRQFATKLMAKIS